MFQYIFANTDDIKCRCEAAILDKMHVFTAFELYGFIQHQRLFYSFISLKDKRFVLNMDNEMYVKRGLALISCEPTKMTSNFVHCKKNQ